MSAGVIMIHATHYTHVTRLNDNGNYYVGMISPRLPGKTHLMEIIGPHYLVRRFLVRLVSLVMIPIKFLNSVIPNPVTMKVILQVSSSKD